jgi:hypothetical protein
MSIQNQHVVQMTSDGFTGSEVNIEFQGSMADCKNFLQKKTEELEAAGDFYGSFADDDRLTLEIFRRVDNKNIGDKYMIHKAI